MWAILESTFQFHAGPSMTKILSFWSEGNVKLSITFECSIVERTSTASKYYSMLIEFPRVNWFVPCLAKVQMAINCASTPVRALMCALESIASVLSCTAESVGE